MGAGTGPSAVVVLGMHRSGTSAVAGYLAKAGFFAGDDADLLPAAEDNPKGFFERTDVNELNDGILTDLGGSWDNPPPRGTVEAKAPAYVAQVRALLGQLVADAGGKPIVLKDPRVSLLLRVWLPCLEEAFPHYALVVVDRAPVEIAQSVRKRDGRPLSVALAMWQLYCTELAHGLAGHRALVVHYQDFVADPARCGPRLLSQVAEALPADAITAASESAAAGFVSAAMRHHASQQGGNFEDQVLTVAQVALAAWMAELPEGWSTLPAPGALGDQPEAALVAVAEYFETMGDRYGMETAYDLERHKALHFEQATELKDQHIANLEAQLEHLRPLVDDQREKLTELQAANEALTEANETLQARLRTLHEDGKAAASNLLSVARRGLAKPSH